MTHLSLFSGIGGLDLAAEWAGFHTVAFVEIDDYCRKVLAKHWPHVPVHNDVRTFDATEFRGVTLLSGGFPCQDVSAAGKGAGIGGERSGLWSEMLRCVRECRPRWVLAENSPLLRVRGADRVLGELEEVGYSAWPLVVGADHAGRPFRGERCFIVASSDEHRVAADWWERPLRSPEEEAGGWATDGRGVSGSYCRKRGAMQPRPYGVADGVPHRVDRTRAIGNAVVPQQAYPIFKAIAEAEESQ